MEREKQAVREFWERASCGEDLYLPDETLGGYRTQSSERFRLEPFLPAFARFPEAAGRKVLEIGVGLGADHEEFARHGADLAGIDLTERAIRHTARRLDGSRLSSRLSVGDAESLAFADETFDLVYSWGVLHHTPDPRKAVSEVRRVLKPGGTARIMIYHKWSLVGLMLWIRYGLLRLRPWRSLDRIYAEHLESPGTKAYSVTEARSLFRGFQAVEINTRLTHGDLLESAAGRRHRGLLLDLARSLWPRRLIRRFCGTRGLFMLVQAVK